jgi:hypothetical protein
MDDPAAGVPEILIPDKKNSITLDLPPYSLIRLSG